MMLEPQKTASRCGFLFKVNQPEGKWGMSLCPMAADRDCLWTLILWKGQSRDLAKGFRDPPGVYLFAFALRVDPLTKSICVPNSSRIPQADVWPGGGQAICAPKG